MYATAGSGGHRPARFGPGPASSRGAIALRSPRLTAVPTADPIIIQ